MKRRLPKNVFPRCPACGGTGWNDNWGVPCSSCDGTGKAPTVKEEQTDSKARVFIESWNI